MEAALEEVQEKYTEAQAALLLAEKDKHVWVNYIRIVTYPTPHMYMYGVYVCGVLP